MINSDDLSLICLLAEEKSLAAVARASNISASAISQRLTALEAKLDIRIAERIGRSGIVMTQEGEFLAQKGVAILDELNALDDQIEKKKGILAGHIKIIAPFGFGRIHLAPLCVEFQRQHPEITVALTLVEDTARIPDSPWDIIVRVAPLRDSSLRMRKLSDDMRFICASPDYVGKFGEPKHPEDLTNHNCVVVSADETDPTLWKFRAKNGKHFQVRVNPKLTTNDTEAALRCTVDGGGIAVLSEWRSTAYIRAGKLIRLLPNWQIAEAPVIALTSGPKGRTGRVQKMLDFFEREIRKRSGEQQPL